MINSFSLRSLFSAIDGLTMELEVCLLWHYDKVNEEEERQMNFV